MPRTPTEKELLMKIMETAEIGRQMEEDHSELWSPFYSWIKKTPKDIYTY